MRHNRSVHLQHDGTGFHSAQRVRHPHADLLRRLIDFAVRRRNHVRYRRRRRVHPHAPRRSRRVAGFVRRFYLRFVPAVRKTGRHNCRHLARRRIVSRFKNRAVNGNLDRRRIDSGKRVRHRRADCRFRILREHIRFRYKIPDLRCRSVQTYPPITGTGAVVRIILHTQAQIIPAVGGVRWETACHATGCGVIADRQLCVAGLEVQSTVIDSAAAVRHRCAKCKFFRNRFVRRSQIRNHRRSGVAQNDLNACRSGCAAGVGCRQCDRVSAESKLNGKIFRRAEYRVAQFPFIGDDIVLQSCIGRVLVRCAAADKIDHIFVRTYCFQNLIASGIHCRRSVRNHKTSGVQRNRLLFSVMGKLRRQRHRVDSRSQFNFGAVRMIFAVACTCFRKLSNLAEFLDYILCGGIVNPDPERHIGQIDIAGILRSRQKIQVSDPPLDAQRSRRYRSRYAFALFHAVHNRESRRCRCNFRPVYFDALDNGITSDHRLASDRKRQETAVVCSLYDFRNAVVVRFNGGRAVRCSYCNVHRQILYGIVCRFVYHV